MRPMYKQLMVLLLGQNKLYRQDFDRLLSKGNDLLVSTAIKTFTLWLCYVHSFTAGSHSRPTVCSPREAT